VSVTVIVVTGLCGRVVPKVRAAYARRRNHEALSRWLEGLEPAAPPVHVRMSVYDNWVSAVYFARALERALPKACQFSNTVDRSKRGIAFGVPLSLILPRHERRWSRVRRWPTLRAVAAQVELALDPREFGWAEPLCCMIQLQSVTTSPLDVDYEACDPRIEGVTGVPATPKVARPPRGGAPD
jgi:hypothetical protein